MRALDLEALQGTSESEGLRAVLTELLGIPCDFNTQPRTMRIGAGDKIGARAFVDLLGSSSIGDEVVQTAVAPTDPDGELPAGGVQETAYGLRERTLQITALSMNQQLHRSARAYLEQLEDKLPFSSTADAFAELGLAVVDQSAIQVLDPEAFGRVSSVASIDLRVRYGTATRDAAIPRIATAHITTAVDGRDPIDLTAES